MIRGVAAVLGALCLFATLCGPSVAQMTTVPYPTPLPVPTPIQLQGVQLIVMPPFTLGAQNLPRYARKQLLPYMLVMGNEAALGSLTPVEDAIATAALYAQRSAKSRAVEARSRGMQAVPLRRGL
jgi:hypothetical protein